MSGHIVALGGGGFSIEPENPLLDDFILSLSRKRRPRICFIPTASADSATYIARFYRAFSERAIPTDLTLFDSPSLPRTPKFTTDLPAFVAQQDIFFVGGGNTANLLAMWRIHGLDKLLRNAWRRGAIMSGISAGMLCWFSGGITDSFGGFVAMRQGLGLIPASACPHYNTESARQAAFQRMLRTGAAVGYAADDCAALHFVGTKLKEAVSSNRAAQAYLLKRTRARVTTAPIRTRLLGS